MNEQVLIASIGLIGVIVGAMVTSIPLFYKERREHKRWLIEKKIAYLKEQIDEIDKEKETTLRDFYNLLYGKKAGEEHKYISSVPMEVIEAIRKHLPDGKTEIADLSAQQKQAIFEDTATAIEKKRQELVKNIKSLLS